MYYLLSFLFLIPLFTGGAFALLLTVGSNDTLKPLLNAYLSQKSGDYTIEINALHFTSSHIDANLTVNQSLRVHVEGSVDLWSQTFDLDYLLFANTFKTKTFFVQEKIALRGKVKGSSHRFSLNGAGDALNAKLDYHLIKEDETLQDVHVDVTRGHLKSFLVLAGQKPYLEGTFDAQIDLSILNINTQTFDGDVSLFLEDGKVDTQLIQKEFNINLPQDFRYGAKIHAKGDKSKPAFTGTVVTTLGILSLKDGKVDLQKKQAQAEYRLEIPKLARLEPVTGKKLRGSLLAEGVAKLDEKRKTIVGTTKSLDGEVVYLLEGEDLQVKFTSVPLKRVFWTFSRPQIAAGELSGNMRYNLKSEQGKVKAKLKDLRILPNPYTRILKKYTSIDVPEKRYDQALLCADIEPSLVMFDLDARAKQSFIVIEKGKYERENNIIDAHFDLNIEGKDLLGVIQGGLDNPKVGLDGARYIQEKLPHEVDKLLKNSIFNKTRKKIVEKLRNFDITEQNLTNPKEMVKGLFKQFL